MGEFLTTPNKSKESTDGENEFVRIPNNPIAEIRSQWYARMAKANGRRAYNRNIQGYFQRSKCFWCF